MMILSQHQASKYALTATRRGAQISLHHLHEEAIMTLHEKRIVVLGGSSGIGLAVAQAAAREGADIIIASSRQERVDAALKTLPPRARGHALDLSDETAIEALFAQLGSFDHLVFTAGENLHLGSLASTDVEGARRFFSVRYWGALLAAKHGSRYIREGGSVVFTSGIAGQRPRSGWAVAASVCSAMEGLTRALAVELAPIRVNIVSPGIVRTPLWAGMQEAEREALYRQTAERLPVGHVGETDEIAEAYLYLMRQSYATGQVLIVDGGAVLV
jgi:NAD(P)-dependent dehydrogenase (short-subunit alcohol dehydrogenase family)